MINSINIAGMIYDLELVPLPYLIAVIASYTALSKHSYDFILSRYDVLQTSIQHNENRILVTEDNIINQKIISAMLKTSTISKYKKEAIKNSVLAALMRSWFNHR